MNLPITISNAGLRRIAVFAAAVALGAAVAGCGASSKTTAAGSSGQLKVATSATFLGDIAQQVGGSRAAVTAIVPRDADLHAFEPATRDLARVADADVIVLNGGGLEGNLEKQLRNAAPQATVVSASAGLTSRLPHAGEPLAEHAHEAAEPGTSDGQPSASGSAAPADPHYWLDPVLVEQYTKNIAAAFAKADPAGAADYQANATAYNAQLESLNTWIRDQVKTIPPEKRLLVMNHVSHGYYADRYGFRIVGAVIPSAVSDEAPTARQLADLTATIRRDHVKAIFVELGESDKVADQIAAETGVKVITDLRDHALSEPGGEAPTYVDMMKYDTRRIVEALR